MSYRRPWARFLVYLLLPSLLPSYSYSYCIRRGDFVNKILTSSTTAGLTIAFPGRSSASSTSASSLSPLSPAVSASPPLPTSASLGPLGKVAFSLLPLYGTSSPRPTAGATLVPDLLYTLDQLQGIVNVDVPVRSTIIANSDSSGGGLLVVNPVAPTSECVSMIRSLENKHGPVRHLLLATSALEHKATFGPFAQVRRLDNFLFCHAHCHQLTKQTCVAELP